MIASKEIQLEKETDALLALNETQKSAHLTQNAELLASTLASQVFIVQAGEVQPGSRQAMLAQYQALFEQLTYERWEDVQPPLIQLSEDGSLASMLVRKLVVSRQNEDRQAALYSWLAGLKKENGQWQVYSLAPSEETLPYATGAAWYEEAMQARELGKQAEYLYYAERAVYFEPNAMHYQYEYARALSLNGQTEQSLEVLNELAGKRYMGLFELENDEAFEALASLPGYARLLKSVEAYGQPTGHSQPAFQLQQRDLIPVGLAYDPQKNVFFISSSYKRKVVQCDANGGLSDFVAPAAEGLGSAIGLYVHAPSRRLWVASAAAPELVPMQQEDPLPCTGLFAFDLDGGELLQRIELPRDEEFFLNDLTANTGGQLFVTESLQGKIFTLKAGDDKLSEVYDAGGSYQYLSGIAITPEGTHLLVAHESGIFVYDLHNQQQWPLAFPAEASLQGIDGLCFYRQGLIAHQTAYPINSLMWYQLSPDWRSITRQVVLEAHHPSFDQALRGCLLGDTYYYIANSQLQSAFEWSYPIQLRPLGELAEVEVLKIELKKVI